MQETAICCMFRPLLTNIVYMLQHTWQRIPIWSKRRLVYNFLVFVFALTINYRYWSTNQTEWRYQKNYNLREWQWMNLLLVSRAVKLTLVLNSMLKTPKLVQNDCRGAGGSLWSGEWVPGAGRGVHKHLEFFVCYKYLSLPTILSICNYQHELHLLNAVVLNSPTLHEIYLCIRIQGGVDWHVHLCDRHTE